MPIEAPSTYAPITPDMKRVSNEKRVPVQLAYQCTVYPAAHWGARPGRWVAGVFLAYERGLWC